MNRREPRVAEPPYSSGEETASSGRPALMAGVSRDGPTVVYITGSGRSGSTLLERALGSAPGLVNVGELFDIFRRDAPQTERCGCGEPFAACTFWTGVARRAFGDWNSERSAAIHRLRVHIARQRQIPRLVAMPLAGRGFRADVARYGSAYETVYRAIAAEAGVSHIVDASKWPAQALALSRAGIDVRMIHLIRDVRGVAYSLSKQGVRRPQALDGNEVMWNKRPAVAAVKWSLRQLDVELMRGCGLPIMRVRYDEFVRHPGRITEQVLTWLGLDYDQADLKHLGEEHMTLGPSHGIAGNPSRALNGEIMLRPDEAWRDKMSRHDYSTVTAIALPLILRYGWHPRRHARS
jgi:sulfotransferase family protein